MASAVDSRLAYARPSAVATASRLPTATRGSNNSYTTSWDTTSWDTTVWPLAFALAADIAGPRQVRQHLRKAHRQLPFQPAWLLRPRLSLAGPPPLAPLRLRCLRLRRRLLPRLDRRRIPRDVLDKMAIHRPRNQRLMQTARQTALGKLGKRPAKTSPRSEAGRHRSSRTAGIACRQPQDARSAPRVVGTSNTALAMKARASAARSSSGRPTWPRK